MNEDIKELLQEILATLEVIQLNTRETADMLATVHKDMY